MFHLRFKELVTQSQNYMNAQIITKKMVDPQAFLDTSTVMSTLWEIQSVLSLQIMNSTGVIMIQLLVSTKIVFHFSN